MRPISKDNAWSVCEAKAPLAVEPGQMEPSLSRETEADAWDVSDIEGRMEREYMEKCNI